MNTWWLKGIQRMLQSLLDWTNRIQNRSPRQQASSLLARQVHIPTPMVTIGAAIMLFALLVPQVGFSFAPIMALAALIALLTLFFVIYIRIDLPQFVNDDEAGFLISLFLVLCVGFI